MECEYKPFCQETCKTDCPIKQRIDLEKSVEDTINEFKLSDGDIAKISEQMHRFYSQYLNRAWISDYAKYFRLITVLYDNKWR